MSRNASSAAVSSSYDKGDSWFGSGGVSRKGILPARINRSRFLVIAICLGLVFLNLWAPAEPTILERLLACAIIIVSAVPAWLWASRRTTGSPIMLFFGAIYGLYYGLPVLSVEHYARLVYSVKDSTFYGDALIPDEVLEQALLLALAGLCVLFLGYYRFARPLERLLPKLKMDWTNLRSLTLTCVPLGILGIAAYYARVVATIPLQVTQFVVFLSDLCLLVITVLFMLQLKHRLPGWGVLFLWAGLIIPRL